MLGVGIVWVGVGLVLWISHKLFGHSDPADSLDNPPQATFTGAMMWPFYLAVYLWNRAAIMLGLRPNLDDE